MSCDRKVTIGEKETTLIFLGSNAEYHHPSDTDSIKVIESVSPGDRGNRKETYPHRLSNTNLLTPRRSESQLVLPVASTRNFAFKRLFLFFCLFSISNSKYYHNYSQYFQPSIPNKKFPPA